MRYTGWWEPALFATVVVGVAMLYSATCARHGAARATGFQAAVRGDLETSLTGSARFDPEGTSIYLGVESRDGAVLLLPSGPWRPRRGSWPVGGEPTDGVAFRALLVTGAPERPTAAFPADTGVLTITGRSSRWLSGHFEFQASSRWSSTGTPERVRVRGTFTAAAVPGRD